MRRGCVARKEIESRWQVVGACRVAHLVGADHVRPLDAEVDEAKDLEHRWNGGHHDANLHQQRVGQPHQDAGQYHVA